MSLITIVNDRDEVVGAKERATLLPGDIYRVSSLWLTNSRDEILLARRALTKAHDPGKWGPAVAGTVEQGESYETTIIRELAEELGLRDIPLRAGEKQFRERPNRSFFVQRFYATLDKRIDEFTLQADEVAEIQWFSRDQLQTLVREHPDHFLQYVIDATNQS